MTDFMPRNPRFDARVRDSFSRQPFMSFIGAELVSVAPGAVEMVLPFQEGLCQQHGFFHGGVVGAVADNACGYAAFTLMAAEDSILTVEYKVNLMAPAAGEKLIARGLVKRSGRTLSVVEADVFAVKNGKEKQVASALATMMCMMGMSDEKQTID